MNPNTENISPSGKADGSGSNATHLAKQTWLKEHQVLASCGITLLFQGLVFAAAYFLGINGRISELEDRVTHIEYQIGTINDSMARLEDSVERSVSRLETSVIALDDKLDRILIALAEKGVKIESVAIFKSDQESAD